MKLSAFLAWCFFLTCGSVFLSNYGVHWTLGRYLTPVSLISPNGITHPDGTPVDGFTLALVRAGIEDEVSLILWGGVVAIFAYVFWMVRDIRRMKRILVQGKRGKRYGLPPRDYM